VDVENIGAMSLLHRRPEVFNMAWFFKKRKPSGIFESRGDDKKWRKEPEYYNSKYP